MSDLGRRVSDLGSRLQSLAADNFAALGKGAVTGEALLKAASQIVPLVPENHSVAWRVFEKNLRAFDRLESDLQAAEIARGLRLCRQLGGRYVGKKKVAADPNGLESLPGIGPKMAENLREAGLETIEDLAFFVPRKYEDARDVAPLDASVAEKDGQTVAVAGSVVSSRFSGWGRRRWVELRIEGPTEPRQRLVIRWFNAHGGLAKRFTTGMEVALAGVVRIRNGQAEMANPRVLSMAGQGPDGPAQGRIIIQYPMIPGVVGRTLEKSCAAAAERIRLSFVDPIPADVLARLNLPPLALALAALHAPSADISREDLAAMNSGNTPWHRRLAFSDLFLLALAVMRNRSHVRRGESVPCPVPKQRKKDLARTFPFKLTGAQQRAIDIIGKDLAQPVPMNRLLQGDVGSGKTAVIFAAALQAMQAGHQVALMAPTEILAEQHFATLSKWMETAGRKVAFISASLPKPVRASLTSRLMSGDIDLVVGTHALLSEGVGFKSLGLCVIDEQHRFGVAQRVRLREKGGLQPHLLVVTATPIPRTLALTAYGDLDVALLDEMPPGRAPIDTKVYYGKKGEGEAYKILKQTLARGERAFVVCPLVEPSEEEDITWRDATTTADSLAAALPEHAVGLVHGRQPQAERAAAMGRFRSGETQVLVATTVIEVGVDVPEASLMMILDADRFGLAQLHQLRGRVGRGQTPSRCLLLAKKAGSDTADLRLGAMADSTDGFHIADVDLATRGPGELLGARQAGLPRLRFGDLVAHTELLLCARAEAEGLLAADPELKGCPALAAALEARVRDARAYGAESG